LRKVSIIIIIFASNSLKQKNKTSTKKQNIL